MKVKYSILKEIIILHYDVFYFLKIMYMWFFNHQSGQIFVETYFQNND